LREVLNVEKGDSQTACFLCGAVPALMRSTDLFALWTRASECRATNYARFAPIVYNSEVTGILVAKSKRAQVASLDPL
jgi:hypothetical protein